GPGRPPGAERLGHPGEHGPGLAVRRRAGEQRAALEAEHGAGQAAPAGAEAPEIARAPAIEAAVLERHVLAHALRDQNLPRAPAGEVLGVHLDVPAAELPGAVGRVG